MRTAQKFEKFDLGLLGNTQALHFRRFIELYSNNFSNLVIISEFTPITPLPEHVKFVKLPFSGRLKYFLNGIWLFLQFYTRKLSIGCLNVHYASGYGTVGAISRHPNIILTVWGSDVLLVPFKSAFHKVLIKANLRSAKLILSTGKGMAKAVYSLFPAANISVCPFGIDRAFFCFENAKDDFSNNSLSRDFIFGSVKGLAHIYGTDILIRAFEKFLATSENASGTRLVLVGSGASEGEYRILAADLGILEKVTFTGSVENSAVPTILETFDVFVSPSRSESFGVASLEASAVGIPVILTKTIGSNELFEDGVNCLMAEIDCVDSLAESMKKMFLSIELRKYLSQNAQIMCLSNYSKDDCDARILKNVLLQM